MANISSANGALTLVGDWAQEDIDLANMVIKAWEFHGEFGLSMHGVLSLENMSGEFTGTGRWSFSSMLEAEFDRWTKEWIQECQSWPKGLPPKNHFLSAETYQALLETMKQKKLRIKISFYDKLEEGGGYRQAGHFISDGKRLDYAAKGSKKEMEWGNRQLEQKGVLTQYQGEAKDVVLKSGITKIGKDAFTRRKDLVSIVIPDGVQEIGWGAFSLCWNLERVILPESVRKIDSHAFFGCHNLTQINVPEKANVDTDAFDTDSPWVKEQGELAIAGNLLIAYRGQGGNVTVPKQVQKISEKAFENCKKVISVTFQGSVKKIGGFAFQNCRNLASITLPKSVRTIELSAFSGCVSLAGIELPKGMKTVDCFLFQGCKNLSHVALPESITTIETKAFSGCEALTELALPSSIKKIGDMAFKNCKCLTSIAIPPNVSEIGSLTFSGCEALTSVRFSSHVNKIAKNAFKNCHTLTIHAPAGNYAEQYAKENNIKFEIL